MIRRLVLLALLALVASAGPAAGARAACPAPRALKVGRVVGQPKVTLRWAAPRRVRVKGYRVWRNRAVVGQTRRRSLVVRVEPGHLLRFTVRAVGAGGRLVGCAAVLKRRLPAASPSTPTGLVASPVESSGVILSWQRSRPGDGRFAGYRIFRDGVPYGQTRAQFTAPKVTWGRRYTFAVAAVDSQGRSSGTSAPVTVDTTQVRPSSPGQVQATPISDSAIRVSWAPSSMPVGRVAGYRVVRDGAPVGQTASTSMDVGRLFPAREYAFKVAAVDSRGNVGAYSTQVVTSTQPPPPTEGTASAFLLASVNDSFDDLRRNYRRIGTIHPTYFDCDHSTLAITGHDDPLVTRFAQLRRVRVMPRFNCQGNADRLHRLLTDPTIRSSWLEGIVGLAQANGYDGIQLDFELGYASDRAAYTSFAADLAARLHAHGRKLSVAASPKYRDNLTHPRAGLFDYAALAEVVDNVFVMSWGIHWLTSAPGPMGDLPWVSRVADYVASMPHHEKFTMGTPFYGTDWPNGGGGAHPGEGVQYHDVQQRIATFGGAPAWDTLSGETRYHYTDAQGVAHELWYTDARSVQARLELARSRGLGIGFWRLGTEDAAIWQLPLLGAGSRWPGY